ncbi:MAG: hypothetical protein DRH37_10135, partial [Deltaproteobacteria bacterium]
MSPHTDDRTFEPNPDDMKYSPTFVPFVSKYSFLICVFILLMTGVQLRASTYQDVGDEVYVILERLEAEGVIKSSLLTTRPLSRKEVVR